MNYEEMQTVLTQMLSIQRQLQENALNSNSRLTRVEAITESNARAIEALGNNTSELDNKMSNLIQIVGEFAQATNKRLEILENTEK